MICLAVCMQKSPTPEEWDLVSGLLYQFHSQGIDEGEEPPPEGEKALIASNEDEFVQAIQPGLLTPPKEFKAYFANRQDAERAERAIAPVLTNYKPVFATEEVEEKDYSEAWRANFQPIPVAPFWLVRATWHAPSTAKDVKELIIEPGMAFGTGSHETTQSCLTLLAEKLSSPKTASKLSILDFGCGSGVLAIAAKKLGAGHVFGVDIDPLAVDATHRNAALNGLTLDASTTMPSKPLYDVIVANILKNTLLDFAPKFYSWLKPGGFLILSGLLVEQRDAITAAYLALGFKVQKTLEAGEWVSLLLGK